VSGPDAGASFVLDGASPGRVYVGKSDACQLKLTDPLVSRRHFAIGVDGGRLRISDLDSTNGTLVNGVAVSEAFLFGGELVRAGDSTIAVRVGANVVARLPSATRFGRVLGASPEMLRLHPICERLALTDVPVIIEGETGTGKELLAEAIHEASPRASGPFIVFDCTTSPPGLVEARLFGHEKGAFTGAVGARPGVFEEASGGTLLIDEIGDLDVNLQAKLLRAVQSQEVQRLGGTQWIKTDVRIIAATRRDLEREIQAGRFRDDLYYRLAVARIELPPLRRRRGDIELLARHFWSTLARDGSSPPEEFLARLGTYAWPGNVRELYNAVLHRVALGEHADVEALRRPSSTAPEPGAERDVIAEVIGAGLPFPQARKVVMEEFEERYVDAVLAKNDQNISKAAASAGIARRYFFTIRSRRGR
jgi:DNA-binding NtrC family response regulator